MGGESRQLPTLRDVIAARTRLAGLAWSTPLLPSPWLSALTGADVHLKLESLQATGSFKARGAANALTLLRQARPDVTAVVTASAGNHGQAIAYAARRLGLKARVYLPASAPLAKHDGLMRLGAEAISTASYDEAEVEAHADAERTGAPYVSPYNDPDVIAGAGTVGLEVFDQCPGVDALFVPVGGGGLLAGVALVARGQPERVEVTGCEASASPVFTAALAQGHPVTVEVGSTLADGLAGNMDPASITFPMVRDLTDDVLAFDEGAIATAMAGLIREERLVVEGASAVAVAAVLAAGRSLAGRRVAVILSGRNVDARVIDHVLRT